MKSFIITYEMSVLIHADSMEDAQKKFDNTNIQEEYNPEFVKQTSIKLFNENKNMENFKFDLDQKVTIWMRTPFEIEAETLEEAKQKAIEFHQKGDTENLSWVGLDETYEPLSVEENDGEPTEELFLDGKCFWNNL